jgi:hypothetical protein
MWTGLSLSIYCYIPLPSTLTYTNQPKDLALSTVTTNIRVARMVRLENVEKYTGGGSDGLKERRGVRRSKGLYFATTASVMNLNSRRNRHYVRSSTEANEQHSNELKHNVAKSNPQFDTSESRSKIP